MQPARTILIKRRRNGTSGAPDSLYNGELAFNEVDKVLYYGSGDNGHGIAENILAIAGSFNTLIQDAYVSSDLTNVSASNDFLIVNINGSPRALRLFDFLS